MLNIWRLQLLVQFEVLGTMQQVADVMHVSKSTVSQQLNLLEQETGVTLFERIGRQVRLTVAGRELCRKVRPVLGQLELIGNSLGESDDKVIGTVHVASFSSAMSSFVLPALQKLSGKYPQLESKVSELEPNLSLPLLDSRQIGIAIVAYLGRGGNLQRFERAVTPIGSDRMQILVSRDNPLARHESVSIEDLADSVWAMEQVDAYLPSYMTSLCKAAGFMPKTGGVFTSYSAMKKAVKLNMMICALPTLAIAADVDDSIITLPLVPGHTRRIFMVTRNSQKNMHTIDVVGKAIQAEARRKLGPEVIE